MEGQRSAMYISFVVQTQAGVSLPGIPFCDKGIFLLRFRMDYTTINYV